MKGDGMKKKNQGVALIITITVITLLIATTMELNRRAGDAAEFTGVTRDRLKLSHLTSSGIHMAMALLVKDKNDGEVDSLQEDWADKETVTDLMGDIPFPEGTLAVEIQDELSKIQVNALVKFPDGRDFNQDQMNMWERFVGYITSGENEDDDTSASAIVNSIKDWLDSGDDDLITGVNGAESDYYKDLEPPYTCRNSPMLYVDELLQVKGVAKLVESVGGWEMLSQYVTVYGMETQTTGNKFTFPGKININTAELPVIAALLQLNDLPLAQEIVGYREEMTDGNYTHDLSNPNWYKNAPGCGSLEIAPNLITTKSDFFRIRATGEMGNVKVTTTAMVQRENKSGKNTCRVLSWQTE
ncbi:MAG: general secretion pathway protein GspK [Desulfobacteraceae bacterium]|nr:MAG: general secretion pathway protein GspK [Desulfobacteraceae bacterium]